MSAVRIWVALGITVLWAISYIVAAATGNYSGLQATTPVMLVAAAWLLVPRRNGDR